LINLGFTIERRLVVVLIIPSSWGSQLGAYYAPSPFHLFNPLDGKILGSRTLLQKTYCKPPPLLTRDWEGPEALPGTLPERGITTGGLLHQYACLRSEV
jgi:hypothetical protein